MKLLKSIKNKDAVKFLQEKGILHNLHTCEEWS